MEKRQAPAHVKGRGPHLFRWCHHWRDEPGHGRRRPGGWHHGRSPAYGEGITFWALGEMVRGRCGLVETDDEATTRVKVAEILAEHVPDSEERRWMEPALLALLGVGSGSGSEQLFAAWRTFFERLSSSGSVVLAFEDLHWADSGTLDFIHHPP